MCINKYDDSQFQQVHLVWRETLKMDVAKKIPLLSVAVPNICLRPKQYYLIFTQNYFFFFQTKNTFNLLIFFLLTQNVVNPDFDSYR